MNRAVFLDRDGVLNRIVFRDDIGPGSPRSLSEFEITPGAATALSRLRDAGFDAVVNLSSFSGSLHLRKQ